jgi:hypothetical protein
LGGATKAVAGLGAGAGVIAGVAAGAGVVWFWANTAVAPVAKTKVKNVNFTAVKLQRNSFLKVYQD